MEWLKSLFGSSKEELPISQEELDKIAKGDCDDYLENSFYNIYWAFIRAGLSEKQAITETEKRRRYNRENQ